MHPPIMVDAHRIARNDPATYSKGLPACPLPPALP